MKTAEEWASDSNNGYEFGPGSWIELNGKDAVDLYRGIQADALDHAAAIVAASHQSVEAEEAIKSLAKSLRG